MKVPLSWLKEYVDFDGDAKALADRLTFSGSEVESIDDVDGDTVLTIEITPNRPDCLSILGMAREVAALCGTRVRRPAVALADGGRNVSELARVDIEDAAGCPRYTARVLTGARVGPSPEWMRKRLAACGVRPINNLVDITNYVMLECGQPLHAFDRTLLKDAHIIVRRARAGETMRTLDGQDRPITADMLLIADAARPVAVAGVMGGAGSEIQDGTSEILLESACFDATSIRATSKALGLSTESSYRFERGVDVETVEWAGRRAAALMVELAGATPARGVIDAWPRKTASRQIMCRFAQVRRLSGMEIGDDEIVRIFEALEIPVARRDAASCTLTIPAFRADLQLEADLIEEVVRMHGLDRIPAPAPRAVLVPGADDQPTRARSAVRSALVGLGLYEVMHYSFVSQRQLDLLDAGDTATRVRLPNPISQDHALLRPSLLPQMAETLGHNRARQCEEAALFEIGRVFTQDAAGGVREDDRIAIGLMGPVGRAGLGKAPAVSPTEMFLWLKGLLEALCATVRIAAPELRDAARPWAEEGQAAEILIGGTPCGVAGLLRSDLRAEWRMTDAVGLLELSLTPLLGQVFRVTTVHPLPAFPSVARDMALLVDASVRNEDVLAVVRAAAPRELTGVSLFDIYTGSGVGAGRKSLAYSLTYQSMERTLTDEEANAMHDAIKRAVVEKLGAEIRGAE